MFFSFCRIINSNNNNDVNDNVNDNMWAFKTASGQYTLGSVTNMNTINIKAGTYA